MDFNLNKKKLDRITFDLKYSECSFEELGKFYGVGAVCIKKINDGDLFKRDYLTYPIRHMDRDNDACDRIQRILISTTMSFSNICKKYKVDIDTVEKINNGEIARNDTYKYPLRRENILSSADVFLIHILLKSSKWSMRTLASIYGVSESTIKRINSGKTKKYRIDETFNYPIRK